MWWDNAIYAGTIIQFFDPRNNDHLRAYRHLEKTGLWPEGFVDGLRSVGMGILWQTCLSQKMAEYWIASRLNES